MLQQRPGIPQARPVGERWLRYRLSQYPDIPPLSALPAQSWRSLIPNFQVVGALALDITHGPIDAYLQACHVDGVA